MGRVLAQVELNDEIGCVVLTGAGDAFSAGGDVKAMDRARRLAEGPSIAYRWAGVLGFTNLAVSQQF